jgi:Zn-dependent peptidase ImmA (M78 family)
MHSVVVPSSEADIIAARIQRLLKEIGNPDPPIDLAQARLIQKLDLRYYSIDSPDLIDRFTHRLRVAGNLFTNFALVKEAVSTMGLKALLVPSKRRILIDDAMPNIKKRWAEAHEITHDLLDWHQDFMFGDSQLELSPGCQEMMEAEANYGAGQLVYPDYFFNDFVTGRSISIETARDLKDATGNSLASACWRLAEQSAKPAFLLVCEKGVAKYLTPSRTFHARFSRFSVADFLALVKVKTRFYGKGPLGSFVTTIEDDDARPNEFEVEAFSNTYSVLIMGVATQR